MVPNSSKTHMIVMVVTYVHGTCAISLNERHPRQPPIEPHPTGCRLICEDQTRPWDCVIWGFNMPIGLTTERIIASTSSFGSSRPPNRPAAPSSVVVTGETCFGRKISHDKYLQ
jgi:hypothetical protein